MPATRHEGSIRSHNVAANRCARMGSAPAEDIRRCFKAADSSMVRQMSWIDRENLAPPVVLFYTDNGFGLGHLTRQAAVASRARGAFRPVFLTMSAGYTLLRQLGFPTEYFPSYGVLGVSKRQWEPLMEQRVLEAIRLTGAAAVVIDHVSPPAIFEDLRRKTTGVKFIWSRRGLWQPGSNLSALDLSDSFDLIVEPGDLASAVDQGQTAVRSHEAIPTDPVVLVDPADFLSREEARELLGLPPSGRAVLINFGDSNPEEVEGLVSLTKSIADSVAPDSICFFSPLHPLHRGQFQTIQGVAMKPVYPAARYLNAFDGAVSSAGYNSFHEIVGSGLPAVFVPRSNSRIDDQTRRAQFASLSGRGHWAPHAQDPSFPRSLEMMLRPRERSIAEKTTSVLGTMRGAYEFADIVAGVLKTSDRTAGAVDDASGDPLADPDPTQGPAPTTTLVIAVESDDEQVDELAATLNRSEKTVVVVADADPSPLYSRGFVFESVMTEPEWSACGPSSYRDYLGTRISGIVRRYHPTRLLSLEEATSSSQTAP